MTAGEAPSMPLAELPPERWPRHIAIIMDGNGRWAERRGLPRVQGHQRGVSSVRAVTEEAARLGHIDALTLYCLSSENWKRPQEELDFLMQMLARYMIEERDTIMQNNIRVAMLGRRCGLPDDVLAEVDKTIEMSAANSGMRLNLAINYGGRAELTDAMTRIAEEVQRGELAPDQIDEQLISDRLTTAGIPDPDLLIRTAGELRISNFLLWQVSYSEIWVTDDCWPDFNEATLHRAILDYARRERRYGGLNV